MSCDSDQAMRRAIERLRDRVRILREEGEDYSGRLRSLCFADAAIMDRIAADLEAALPLRREFVCGGCGRTVGDSDKLFATEAAFYCEQCAAEKRAVRKP